LFTAQELDADALTLTTGHEQLHYSAQSYRWVKGWRVKDEGLSRLLSSKKRTERQAYSSADEYFKAHKLYEKRDGQDVHFAERLFVQRAFIPVFGVAGLTYLHPQVAFESTSGKRRSIDFVLEGSVRYAIEIEGAAYHDKARISRERFEDEKTRQQDLLVAGYRYLPFTYAQLTQDMAEARLNELWLDDTVLYKLRQRAEQGDGTKGLSHLAELETLLKGLPERYPRYQLLALSLLYQAAAAGRDTLKVVDYRPLVPTLSIALMDTVALVERVAELYGVRAALPKLDIFVATRPDNSLHDALLTCYRELGTALDGPRQDVSVRHGETLPDEPFDFISAGEAVGPVARKDAVPFAAFERLTAPFVRMVGTKPPLAAKAASTERRLLDYFARRYFTAPELKPEQLTLLQRALREESGLGLLSTGFGKSLVFQLYALLTPRTTLVISPLKALIRYQAHGMHRLGLTCVESLSSTDSAPQKDRKLAGFREHRFRLLYISPERLQIKKFADELKRTLAETPVGALVVDEAHCVSEWGHDFRPAYLQIGGLRRTLETASGRTVPIIALTATASEPVRRDIVSVLGLPPESVVQLRSSDRPNLSLSVHPTGGQPKGELLEHLLRDLVPGALRIPFDELLPVGEEPPYEHAGVVFAIYANSHGRTSLSEGVHYIADYLQRRVTFASTMVQVHASTAPQVCPECESPLYTSVGKKELQSLGETNLGADKRCTKCGHVFNRPKRVSGWDEDILERQDAFKDNDFPLLVATKGYGMGVDKPNLRFVIHHAMSSGLEGYYQEAGRAGRDGKQAHVALIYEPPTSECESEFLLSGQAPPCVTNRGNLLFHRCPYGLDGLCDYGKQARFIAVAYPGEDESVVKVMSAYERVVSGEPIVETDEEEKKALELSLYRLQQLGIIRGYTLNYKTLLTVAFEVDFDIEWETAAVAKNLKAYLLRTNVGEADAETALKRVQELSTGRRRRVGKDSRYLIVEEAAKLLVKRIYLKVPTMRYEMLRNQLLYATTERRGLCRRLEVRSRLDDAGTIPTEDYRCGFCDVCVPSLRFERNIAEVPTRDAQIDELAQKLPVILDSFDVNELPQVVQVAADKGAIPGLFSRVSSRLERDATNVTARYLAGALARRQPGFERLGLEHLRFGYQEARRQGVGRDGLLLTYREASFIEPQEAFGWISEAGGVFDNTESLALLEEEAARALGENSEARRNLQGLRSVRSLAAASSDVSELAGSVDDLLGGFDELERMGA